MDLKCTDSGRMGVRAAQPHDAVWTDTGQNKLVPYPKTFLGIVQKKYLTIRCPDCGILMSRYARVDQQRCEICKVEQSVNVHAVIAICIICHRQQEILDR